MASVLLWVTGLNALVTNAELDPPDGKRGEPTSTATRERRPVVRPNPFGQSELTEGGLEDGLNAHCLRRPKSRASEQHPAERIG
jgi:hypothetical protein